MSLKSKDTIEKSFQELSSSISEPEKMMIETRLMMYRFLSEIDKVTNERGINRKELASLIGISASYMTQLYQGKKIINLQLLTRIKKALNIDFKIEVIPCDNIADCNDAVTAGSKKASGRILISKSKIHGKISHIHPQVKMRNLSHPEAI